MSDHGLTTAEAAARLGVKKETVYAYVSRGLLHRTVAADGRTSRFEGAEIDRLAQDRRPPAGGELRTTIATSLTRVDDQGLWIRGHDLVGLVDAGAGFTDVADLVWGAPEGESWDLSPDGPGRPPPGLDASLLDALRVITALRSAADPLRHDLSPHSVRAVGRSLIAALCHHLPRPAGADTPPLGGTGSPRPGGSPPQPPGGGSARALTTPAAVLWGRL